MVRILVFTWKSINLQNTRNIYVLKIYISFFATMILSFHVRIALCMYIFEIIWNYTHTINIHVQSKKIENMFSSIVVTHLSHLSGYPDIRNTNSWILSQLHKPGRFLRPFHLLQPRHFRPLRHYFIIISFIHSLFPSLFSLCYIL